MKNEKNADFCLPTEEVSSILKWIGEDPTREGLVKTPLRFLNFLKEQCSGYEEDPSEHLNKALISNNYSTTTKLPITLKNIKFQSLCEHHLAAFTGIAHVSYIPNKNIVGISKLARVVDVLSKRLQIQEKLTKEIATVIDEVLKPFGVYVVLEGNHTCMSLRGVKKEDSIFKTSFVIGDFYKNKDKELIDV